MAKENRDWGYDRIAGALANLGDQSEPPDRVLGAFIRIIWLLGRLGV